MIPNHKWVKPKQFAENNELLTPCFVCIDGDVFRAHLSSEKYGLVGFRVYHYDKYSERARFVGVDDSSIHGVTIDDFQGVPELR